MKILYALCAVLGLGACAKGAIFENATPVERAPLVVDIQNTEDNLSATKEVVVKEKEKSENIKQRTDYVPYVVKPYHETASQKVYTILASRAVNKMLRETTPLYENAKYPTLYIKDPLLEGTTSVPENSGYAMKVTKDIVTGSHSYLIVDSLRRADYVLDTHISSNLIASRGTEVVVYKLVLTDKDGKEVGSWVEMLSPITNDDQSWW